MRRRVGMIVLALLLGVTAILIPVSVRAPQPQALSAPNLFTGVINGGCYAHAGYQCSLRVDSFQPIAVDAGQRLQAVQLRANGNVIYDFRSDLSNPPAAPYVPSNVALDFAAQCGTPYEISLYAMQSNSSDFTLLGTTNQFTCPLLETPTPTFTPTHTATPTHTSTPTRTHTPTPESVFLPQVSGSSD